MEELVIKWLALFQDKASSLHIAVTAAVFRCGVQYDVSAKFEWPLKNGRSEGVIHQDEGAGVVSDLGDGCDVSDVHSGI